MASESRPPGSGDVNPAQASELPQAPTGGEGQVSAEPPKETPAKSVFVNSEPIREDQVQNAVKFLSHPRVQGSPVIHRRNFLERKGLTKEEIDEAFRRVPDTSPGVTSTQPTTSQDGHVRTSANIQQQGSPQALQPVGGAPSGVVSGFRRQFHWYHAFIAVGCLAASGAGTVIIFKNTIVPRLRSWIRKAVSDDDDDNVKKNESRPSLIEEAAAAAKAAAAAAADAAKASQEMVIMKSEENKRFEKFMNLLDDQLQEIKSMKTAVWKLEGQNYNSGRGYQAEQQYLSGSTSHLKQPVANGRTDYDSRPARSSSPTVSSEPPHPASYMEIMSMIQRGEKPPNVRDINDAPPNPNQPISNPNLVPRAKPWETVQPARTTSFGSQDNSFPYQLTNDWQQKNVKITEIDNEDGNQSVRSNGDTAPIVQPPQRKWVPPQPPPVAMPEAAIAIRQPKSKAPKEGSLDSTSSNGSEIDELHKITKVAESGGEPEVNGGGVEMVPSSEIQEEQVSS